MPDCSTQTTCTWTARAAISTPTNKASRLWDSLMSQQAGQNSSARDEGDALQRGPLDRAPGDGALHEARLEASADQEHERVRDLLRESEAGLRGLIEAYAQATWETDANGVVVVDSPSWRAQTG